MKRTSNRLRRRAAAMMLALVVLLVVGMTSAAALRAILQSHRQTREEAQRAQAELLADAALSRAVSLLQKDAAWKGETWKVELGETEDAKATGVTQITVTKAADQPAVLRISVSAIYPDDPIHRAQATTNMSYTTSQTGANP